MGKKWLIWIIPTILIVFVGVLFLIKVLWAWVIPDIFPGAIEQGLIARSISWGTAFKIALLVGIVSGVIDIRGNKNSQ
jgi:hypothetical protein